MICLFHPLFTPSIKNYISGAAWNVFRVTKGTNIGNHCVVATGSVVEGYSFPDHCAIGGNLAKVVKEGISWRSEMI